MEQRTRTRTRTIPDGKVCYPGPGGPVIAGPGSYVDFGITTTDWWKKKRRLYDLTGVGLPPSDFDSSAFWRRGVPMSGGYGPAAFWFKGMQSSFITSYNQSHYAAPAGKDLGDSFYVTKLLARTNPYRSTFSVPVIIKELVETASLFNLVAKSFVSFVGGAYLNYRFGWKAFLNDILTLAKIVEQVDRRVKEFVSLGKRGGLRRKSNLDSWAVTKSGKGYVVSSTYGYTVACDWTKVTRQIIWGSVRWFPTDINQVPNNDAERFTTAVRQVFDLETIDAETVYNLIPFSWLVDYFSNLGDFLAAGSGRALVEPHDICIMRKTETYEKGVRSDSNKFIAGGSYTSRLVTHQRRVKTEPVGFTAFSQILTLGEFEVVLALLAKFRG